MIMEKPKCDECGGMEFEIEQDDAEKVIPASEYFPKQSVGNTLCTTSCGLGMPTYMAKCKQCGKVYRY